MTVLDQTWFGPLPKQLRFLQSHARELVYAGGFGSGKTLVGGFKALVACLEHPGTVGMVARQTYRALEDSTKKTIVDGDDKPPVFPPEAGYYVSGDEKFVFHNGSEVLFRSFQDWNEQKLLGPNYGFIYVDELTECSERVWLLLNGRLRHPAGPRQAWGTTNPNGHDWVWRRFHPDSGQQEPVAELIHAPTEENVHLSEDYIHWLRSQPLEWQKRFVDANFDTAAGIIWEEWNWRIHVVPPFEIPYQWKRFESLDHGRRNPTAVLWHAIDPDGHLLVFDGYYEPGLVSQHATAIKTLRGARKYGPIVSDPDCFIADHDGQTVAAEYAKHKIQLVRGNNEVSTGLNRVSEWLLRDPTALFPDWHPFGGTLGDDGLGSPLLFVLDVPGTQDLRREIPQYVWKDLSPTMAEKVDEPEEPRKKDDHACDALRYGVMSRPRPNPPPDVPREKRRPRPKQVSAGIADKTF